MHPPATTRQMQALGNQCGGGFTKSASSSSPLSSSLSNLSSVSPNLFLTFPIAIFNRSNLRNSFQTTRLRITIYCILHFIFRFIGISNSLSLMLSRLHQHLYQQLHRYQLISRQNQFLLLLPRSLLGNHEP
eukprot:TRINITY_DN19752_c0_g1_i14.p1 TRINITY_DN19752_c0_g1~~TRINITY_DN19752_c0_g1_i14.p1  ORF type:complete len:131 (+),score=8.75 TRINITY_DN19752_c0_g1_i14:226-618(+)